MSLPSILVSPELTDPDWTWEKEAELAAEAEVAGTITLDISAAQEITYGLLVKRNADVL